MNNDRKRELKEQYKSRTVVGCIYLVRNQKNNRFYLNYSDVSAAAKNSYELATSFGNAFKPSMQKDWTEFGAGAFTFEILEELEKKETQTDREFRDDLQALCELWLEKLVDSGKRY